MSYLVQTSSLNTIISKKSNSYRFYNIPVNYTQNQLLLLYPGQSERISQSFEFRILQYTAMMNEIFQFSYENINGQQFTFSLKIKSGPDHLIILNTCNKKSDFLRFKNQIFEQFCQTPKGSLIYLKGQLLTQYIFQDLDWVVTQQPTGFTFSIFYIFYLELSYIPNYILGSQPSTLFNYLLVTLQSIGFQNNFVNIQNNQFDYQTSPPFCKSYNDQYQCTSCQPGFSLYNSSCICQYTLSNYTQLISQPIAYNNTQKYLYFKQANCQNNTSLSSSFTSCKQILQSTDNPLQLQVLGTNLLSSDKEIEVNLNYTNALSFSYLDQTCLLQTFISFSQPIKDNQNSTRLSIKLGPEIPFQLKVYSTLLFQDLSFCDFGNITSANLFYRICKVYSNFDLRTATFNETIIARKNVLILIYDLSSMSLAGKIFQNYFLENQALQIQNSEFISSLVCKDNSCQKSMTSNQVLNSDIIFITNIINDPVYISYQPGLQTQLYFNSKLRQSLMLSNSTTGRNTFLSILSLDSTELANVTNITLVLSYSLNNTSKFTRSFFVNFVLNITTSSYYVDPNLPFLKSFAFIWILSSLIVVVICLLFGVFAYTVSYCQKKERHEEQEDKCQAQETEMSSRFQKYQAVQNRGEKKEIIGNQLNRQQDQEASAVLEKLM